jgi:hypothetical protein
VYVCTHIHLQIYICIYVYIYIYLISVVEAYLRVRDIVLGMFANPPAQKRQADLQKFLPAEREERERRGKCGERRGEGMGGKREGA